MTPEDKKMNILMIYWNSVWTNSRRDNVSLLADRSGADLKAYRRALRAGRRPLAWRGAPETRSRVPISVRAGNVRTD